MGSKEYKSGSAAVACADLNPNENEAGLCYIGDGMTGYSRKKWGRGFSYFDDRCRRIRDDAVLARIKGLVIPPAWSKVWICPLSQGHIQATGRDADGRLQYIYHARWVELRQQYKYDRLIEFSQALTRIRKQVDADLRRRKLDLEKVSGVAVALLDATRIRIGNREYERQNHSHGLTTLKARHVMVTGSSLKLDFTGKSGQHRQVALSDRRLARQVARCQELPGQELFQYLDDNGDRRRLSSEDVNAYLRRAAGKSFTAKDLRTWWETVLMADTLRSLASSGPAPAGLKNGLPGRCARWLRLWATRLPSVDSTTSTRP